MTSLPVSGPSRHAVYTGRATSWPMVACTSFGAVFLVLSGREADGAWTDRWLVVPLLLVAVGIVVNVLTASSVRATVGPNGVTVRWGLVGWPRGAYVLDRIVDAEVVDLPWWRVSWGFWWTPKRTTCTVRSGPNLRLSLRNGRIVTITVPDPVAAATALRQAMAAEQAG